MSLNCIKQNINHHQQNINDQHSYVLERNPCYDLNLVNRLVICMAECGQML